MNRKGQVRQRNAIHFENQPCRFFLRISLIYTTLSQFEETPRWMRVVGSNWRRKSDSHTKTNRRTTKMLFFTCHSSDFNLPFLLFASCCSRFCERFHANAFYGDLYKITKYSRVCRFCTQCSNRRKKIVFFSLVISFKLNFCHRKVFWYN